MGHVDTIKGIGRHTEADAKQHGGDERQGNVEVEQRGSVIHRRRLHQPVQHAAYGSHRHDRVRQPRAQLQVEAESDVHSWHVERPTACGVRAANMASLRTHMNLAQQVADFQSPFPFPVPSNPSGAPFNMVILHLCSIFTRRP